MLRRLLATILALSIATPTVVSARLPLPMRFATKRVALPLVQNVRFGALTAASGGRVAVRNSTIVAGNGSGHWQIASGLLTPSSAGDTANLNAGPYVLTLGNGDTVNISIDANAWDVGTQAEWDAVIVSSAATLSAKTIYLRPALAITTGVNGSAARLRRGDYGGLTIESRDFANKATFDRFELRGTRNVTFRGLKRLPSATNAFRMLSEDTGGNVIAGITIDQNEISGAVGDPNGNYATSSSYPNNNVDLISTGTVGATGPWPRTNITITNNLIEWADTAITVTGTGGATQISGNLLRYFYTDGIVVTYGGADVATTVADNLIMLAVGKTTDSALPHCDGIQLQGSATATTDWAVGIYRNVILQGDTRNDSLQTINLDDFKTSGGGDSGRFFIPTVVGNVGVAKTPHGILINQAKNAVVLNNSMIAPTISPTSEIGIRVGHSGTANATSSGVHRLERNVADVLLIGGSPTLVDNLALGRGGATVSYATAFVGSNWNVLTRADLLSVFARKAGGPLDLTGTPDIGAIGSGAVTFPVASPGGGGSHSVN